MTGLEMVQFIHHEMGVTDCFGSILKDWSAPGSMTKSHMQKLKLTALHFKHGLTNLSFCDMTFKSKNFFQYIEKAQDEEDVFFSINSFYNCVRKTENIRHLNAFAIDYDFYKKAEYKHKTPTEMWEIIRPTLPLDPTFVVSSGRGLYVIYALHHAPKACIAFYQAIYKKLVDQQHKFGADPAASLTTQVIRVPGSINTKTLSEVTILYSTENRYYLNDFECILPYTKEEAKTYLKKKKENKILSKRRFPRRRLNGNLFLQDISTLIELRNEQNIDEGYRELLLYIVWERLQYQQWDVEKIKKVLESINNKFNHPMDLTTVYKQCKPPKEYKHASSLKTIIRKLNIAKDEQKHMKLLICDTERLRRYQKGIRRTIDNKTKKQKDIRNRREQLLELLVGKHQSLSEISRVLGISIKTLKRDLMYIKEHMPLFEKLLKRLFLLENQTHEVYLTSIVKKYFFGEFMPGQKMLL